MVVLTSALRDRWVRTRALYSVSFCLRRADGSTGRVCQCRKTQIPRQVRGQGWRSKSAIRSSQPSTSSHSRPSAAREIGTFSLKTKGPTPQEVTGKYLVVWEKIGSDWKLAADIWNDGK